MAESSYPTPANGRLITEPQYERLMATIQSSGLIGAPTLPSLVYADGSGRLVKVRANRGAYVRGRYWDSGNTEFALPIPANTTGAIRRDLIVLRLNRTTWNVTTEVKTGSTVTPALTQDVGAVGTYEIPLAQVNVPNGATSLGSGDVVPLAWYLGATPIVCTSTSQPPVTVGGLMLQVVTTTVGTVTTTQSTLHIGVPASPAPRWQALVTAGTAPLGAYFQYIGNAVSGLVTPTVHIAMANTAVTVLPSRYVRITARNLVTPNVANASAQLDILIAGAVYESSGRIPCTYTTNPTGLDAEFFFRTAPNQTQAFVAIYISLYPGASATTYHLEPVHVNVVDHGPVPSTVG